MLARAHRCPQIDFPSHLRDVLWATHTVKFGWAVAGIYGDDPIGPADVTAVARNHRGLDLIVVADPSARLRLFRYPASSVEVLCVCTLPVAVPLPRVAC